MGMNHDRAVDEEIAHNQPRRRRRVQLKSGQVVCVMLTKRFVKLARRRQLAGRWGWMTKQDGWMPEEWLRAMTDKEKNG